MIYKIHFIILTVAIISCSPEQSNNRGLDQEINKDLLTNNIKTSDSSYFQELSSIDFIVKPQTYSVEFTSKCPYKLDSIEFSVMAELDIFGNGEIKGITIFYKEKSSEIKYLKYPIFTAKELLDFKKYPKVNFVDYNFDNWPDLEVHNKEASGAKNQVYDVYIFDLNKQRYYFNRFLSSMPNSYLNVDEKTLTTFAQGGMASQIYSRNEYKWNEEKFISIKSENQIYSDSLDRFIRTTKILENSIWLTQKDTLESDELSR